MKYVISIFFSFLLTLATIAPAVISLYAIDFKTYVAVDFNEEENNKEEKKQLGEQEFFYASELQVIASKTNEKSGRTHFYIEGSYSSTVDVFLQPPKSF